MMRVGSLGSLLARGASLAGLLFAVSLVASCSKKSGSGAVIKCIGLEPCKAACQPCEDGKCSAAAAASCRELGELHLRGQPPQFDVAESTRVLVLGCERGDLRSCSAAANHIQDGRGRARDADLALKLYEKSCEGGVGVGCFNLATMLTGARGVTPDEARSDALHKQAAALYEKECGNDEHKGSDLSWCVNYGVLYENGFGVERDANRAAQIYRRGCDGGDADSCVNLILIDLQDPDRPKPANPTEADKANAAALATLERGCDGGSRLSCGVLGSLLLKGRHGITPKPERAKSLLRSACDDGERNACFTLAAHSLLDRTPEGLGRALTFAKRACDLGDSISCLTIGQMATSRAPGLMPEDEFNYYRRACDIGNGEGCGFAGLLYEKGRGVRKNEALGAKLLADGCRLGYAAACVELINRGTELPLSPERNAIILERTCKQGLAAACAKLGRPAPTP